LFIEKFEGKYVKVVLAVVLVMMFLPYFLLDWAFTDSIYRAMILLVVASPCALVASIMPATLSAISSSAKRGVLLKGGVHAENMGHIKMIAFDKTGTLTNGKPVVTDVYVGDNEDSADIIAIAGEVEKESTHPLARAITAYSAGHSAQPVHISDVKTISGNGLAARVDHVEWKIGKAAFVGEEAAYHFRDRIGEKLAAEGKTVVFVKKDNKISALFALKDTIRKDIKTTIKTLKKQGIHTVMLTGDNEVTAKAIANEAGIDTYIANCLPEKKAAHIKKFGETYRNVAMVGDGINDAPALASANVGIAMGEGTDVALETADVVLMKNDLSKIIDAIRLSGRMNRVVKQNIFFSLFVITLLIITNFFQLLDLPLGVIGHEGSTILVILNGLRLLK
jgi:Cd2+/Zn2+-exporting ATPase